MKFGGFPIPLKSFDPQVWELEFSLSFWVSIVEFQDL